MINGRQWLILADSIGICFGALGTLSGGGEDTSIEMAAMLHKSISEQFLKHKQGEEEDRDFLAKQWMIALAEKTLELLKPEPDPIAEARKDCPPPTGPNLA